MRTPLALAAVLAACAAEPPALPQPSLSTAPDAPPEEVLRFVAVGDTGKGNDVERRVATAMKTACDARGGCRFALLLGDNIYQSGASTPDDPQFRTKFEEPFAVFARPFWAVLGNHDDGGDGAGWEFWKGANEVEWTRASTLWRMPARHYAFSDAHADFFALDTNALFWGVDDGQRTDFTVRRMAATRPWRIAFGHHPYLSNGKHGDAGGYDGLPAWLPGSGSRWRDFFEQSLCGQVDVYFSGHDHELQDFGERCGVQLVVSGAGSSPKPLVRRDRTLFQAEVAGFVLVEVTSERLTLAFVDGDANELSRRVVRRARATAP